LLKNLCVHAYGLVNFVLATLFVVSKIGCGSAIQDLTKVNYETIFFLQFNQKWLDTQLSETKGNHIFTYTHEPAFKLDHTDCLQGNSCPTMQINYSKSRNRFWKSLRDAGARVYFCGHDHGYAHVVVKDGDGNPDNDIHQFSLGTAGAGKNLKPVLNGYNAPYTPMLIKCDNSYGYMVVEVKGANVDLTWKRMNDKTGKFEIGERFSYSLKSEKYAEL